MKTTQSTTHDEPQQESTWPQAWPVAVVPLTAQSLPISLERVRDQGIPALAFATSAESYSQIPPTHIPPVVPPEPEFEPEPDPLRRMSLKTTAIVGAFASLLFLLIAAMLFREPINDFTKAHLQEAEQKAAAAREQARVRALENTVTVLLNDANSVWTQLSIANATLAARIELLLGQPLESAIASPPASLRKAVITSDATLYAWTNMINTRVTPQEMASSDQLLTTVRSHLAQHAVNEAEDHQLRRFLDWAAKRRQAIEAIDLNDLGPNQSLDGGPATPTINAPERRFIQ